jgi:hypothetical protein
MDVTEALDGLRAEVEGCELVAYADLSSRMVLSVSAATKYAQEDMDVLSQSAVALLDGALAEGAQPLIGEDDQSADLAMTLSVEATRIFLRAPGDLTEALICVCAPSSDLSNIVNRGRATLGRIIDQS